MGKERSRQVKSPTGQREIVRLQLALAGQQPAEIWVHRHNDLYHS
jgi:hypothetical protein